MCTLFCSVYWCTCVVGGEYELGVYADELYVLGVYTHVGGGGGGGGGEKCY